MAVYCVLVYIIIRMQLFEVPVHVYTSIVFNPH